MPSVSKKQQRFMGAELGKLRSGKRTKTNMSETQLREYAANPPGSLHDIDFHEDAAERETVMNGEEGGSHAMHKGYDCFVAGNLEWPEDGDEPEGHTHSANRDNGWGIHYGAKVDYFGPDTDYRVEEINPHQYGRDYEPSPFKDYFKTGDKAEEVGLRLREEYKYSELVTPGTVPDKGMDSSLAHGSMSYEKVPVETEDHRSFKSQQYFRRAQDESKEDTVMVRKVDTKYGKNIR